MEGLGPECVSWGADLLLCKAGHGERGCMAKSLLSELDQKKRIITIVSWSKNCLKNHLKKSGGGDQLLGFWGAKIFRREGG